MTRLLRFQFLFPLLLVSSLFLPLLYQIWLFSNEDLGAQPAETLNKHFGLVTLILLVANLHLGSAIALWRPLPSWLRPLIKVRRQLGVITMFYAVLHLAFYVTKEGDLNTAVSEIQSKTYLTAGLMAWLILLFLSLTSNDWSVRWLRPTRWKKLHRWVYVAFVFVAIHTFLIEKGDKIEFTIYLAPVALLLIWRMIAHIRRQPWQNPFMIFLSKIFTAKKPS